MIGIWQLPPKCDRCKRELTSFGGILLSPPDRDEMVRKYHLCRACYELIVRELSRD